MLYLDTLTKIILKNYQVSVYIIQLYDKTHSFKISSISSSVLIKCVYLPEGNSKQNFQPTSTVIFFWSSGIIDCMFVYIWKWSSAHALGGVSGVASFITTDEQLQ